MFSFDTITSYQTQASSLCLSFVKNPYPHRDFARGSQICIQAAVLNSGSLTQAWQYCARRGPNGIECLGRMEGCGWNQMIEWYFYLTSTILCWITTTSRPTCAANWSRNSESKAATAISRSLKSCEQNLGMPTISGLSSDIGSNQWAIPDC